MTYSERETERQLKELEKRITEEYRKAWEELDKRASSFYEDYKRRRAAEYEKFLNGQYTLQQWNAWQQTQLGRWERWKTMRDEMARRMAQADKVARSYINDKTPGILTLHGNYTAYEIEMGSGVAIDIFNEEAVKRLIADNPQLLPAPSIDIPKALRWNNQRLQSALISGILAGEDIDKIAKRFMNVADMNRKAAIRNARTATTGAANAGKQIGFERATDMGIELKKEWMATHDARTRDSHAYLDGEVVSQDKPFSNGLMFPGDPSGAPAEVYNCRCTMRAVLKGYEQKPRMTYNDWLLTNYENSGGKTNIKRLTEEYLKRSEKAVKYYKKFMREDDSRRIANASGFSVKDIKKIRNHIFFRKHEMRDGSYKKFVPDYDMAVAWERLRRGKPEDRDILLLKHELLELQLEKRYNIPQYEAHYRAKKEFDWEKELEKLEGGWEDYDILR